MAVLGQIYKIPWGDVETLSSYPLDKSYILSSEVFTLAETFKAYFRVLLIYPGETELVPL